MARPRNADRPKSYPSSTRILDLDALDTPTIVIKIKGIDHELKQISVRDFVRNTKEMEALELSKSGDAPVTLEAEMNSVVKMLARTFPTMSEEEFFEMSLAQLYKIFDFAKKHNGTSAVEAEASSTENPQTAVEA